MDYCMRCGQPVHGPNELCRRCKCDLEEEEERAREDEYEQQRLEEEREDRKYGKPGEVIW